MLKKLFHHASSQKDCARLCCTKIENFGVKAGRLVIFEDAQVYNYDEGKLTTILKGREEIGKAFRDYLALFETVYHINGQHHSGHG